MNNERMGVLKVLFSNNTICTCYIFMIILSENNYDVLIPQDFETCHFTNI
jgi:hypothetical protein